MPLQASLRDVVGAGAKVHQQTGCTQPMRASVEKFVKRGGTFIGIRHNSSTCIA